MPHMKYFQGIADIEDHYDRILNEFDNKKWGPTILSTWGIAWSEEEKTRILEEKEVLRYLIGCQLGLVHDNNVKKPTLEVVNRCFNRQLKFLETVHKINQWNVNKHPNKITKRKYKTCRHYLFKFSLQGWVDRLPEEILTYENKWGKPNFQNK